GVGITIDDSENLHVTPSKSVLEWRGSPPFEPRLAGVVGQGCRGAGTGLAVSVHRGAIRTSPTSTPSGRRRVTLWCARRAPRAVEIIPRGERLCYEVWLGGEVGPGLVQPSTLAVARVRPIGGRRVQ